MKDVICKYKRQSGYFVNFRPGFDCHGLPIELSLQMKQEENKLNTQLKIEDFRTYVNATIVDQIADFKRLGVLCDWNQSYRTDDFAYQSSIMQAFKTIFEKKFIQRKFKPVPWCSSCQTVLSGMELEYASDSTRSAHVLFFLKSEDVSTLFPKYSTQNIGLLVW